MEKYLEIKDLSFGYKKNLFVLRNLNFCFNRGEKILVLATKDMGKSTFLSVISSFEKSYNGEILLNGKELKTINDSDKKFSFLPQTPIFFEKKSVVENINYFCKNNKLEKFDEQKLNEKLTKNSFDFKADEKVKNLSKLNKARLSFFRSLLKNPNIIFLDNQFEYLSDEKESLQLEKEYEKLINSFENTLIFALDENVIKNRYEFVNNLKINKILYLVDTKVYEFNDLEDFKLNPKNLNQLNFLNNFCNNNYEDGYILKDNENYYFSNDDNFIIKFDSELSKIFVKLNLEEKDTEDCRIFVKDNVNLLNLSTDNFNNLIKQEKILIFSTIDNERIL